MRRIDLIVIHCAATVATQDIGVAEIDQWHRKRGWAGVGYHYVIRRNGTMENGRPTHAVGSHAAGHNANSIGICLVGGVRKQGSKLIAEDNFTLAQWDTLRGLVSDLMQRFPGAKVVGHRDLDQRKECPSFDVRSWLTREGLHSGIEWDSGTQADPPKPLLATKTAAGTVITAASGLAAVADVDSPEQIAQVAQTALLGVPAGTWISLLLGVVIVGASALALYGRWDARRRSGV